MSTATQSENDSLSIFEFDFVATKPSTKVDSVFDLVNGNGQHTTNPEPKREHVVNDAGPLSTEWNDTYDSPPWSAEPEARLQAADSALEAAMVLDEIQSQNHEELILTQSEVLDGATSTTLIKSPDIFEFEQSESLDPTDPADPTETINPIDDVAIVEQNAEIQYQIQINKWERHYELAKIAWDANKHKTEQEQIALALEVKRISDELKEVRQSHKSVIATLEDLNKLGPDYPERPVKGKPVSPVKQPSKPPNQPAEVSSGSPVPANPAPVNTDESWRTIKSDTFLTLGIEGMGQKKLDTLLHEYPTLGDLVDLQTEASKKCLHLCKLLPKGIGKKLADSIDNAVMDAFAKHCKGDNS